MTAVALSLTVGCLALSAQIGYFMPWAYEIYYLTPGKK